MPFLFLSPSTQEYNPYVTSGNEEYWMNRLADRMVPYLEASGINVTRNDPNGTVGRFHPRFQRGKLRFSSGSAQQCRAGLRFRPGARH